VAAEGSPEDEPEEMAEDMAENILDRARGRIAVVTGASRGIGAGIAAALAGAGYRVAAGFERSEERAVELASRHPGMLPLQIDIGDAASVDAAFRRVREELGPVEVLVNNAAIAQEKPFLDLTDDDWRRMLEVNLLGAVRTTRAVLSDMIAGGFGRIVNVSSIGGQWGGVNQLHYAASKAALINLTRSIAKSFAGQGITCNAISPGLIATEMSAAEIDSEEGRAKVVGIPCGRLGTVEEAGAAVRYLVSEDAGYVTGQTVNLNGGMYFD
jgi:NAD(P)-dependent dehydrogenase (short-subunit alcohol dehydrogenase family)